MHPYLKLLLLCQGLDPVRDILAGEVWEEGVGPVLVLKEQEL